MIVPTTLIAVAVMRRDLAWMTAAVGCGLLAMWIISERYWFRPTRVLRRSLAGIRSGSVAIAELDAVVGPIGLSAVVPDIQRVLADHKGLAGTMERRIERHVSHRTSALEHKLDVMRVAADRDLLTGLKSRTAFDRVFPALVEQLDTQGRDIALVAFGIDRFKPLNDTLGREAGDEFLAQVGQVIAGQTREEDQAFRFDGDEFVVVLPDRKRGDASAFAARIADLAAGLGNTLNHAPPPTLSFGVADWHADFADTPT
ncbi:MAG: GGDEF domain-containing protein, partial [Planctomycetota bacterium]